MARWHGHESVDLYGVPVYRLAPSLVPFSKVEHPGSQMQRLKLLCFRFYPEVMAVAISKRRRGGQNFLDQRIGRNLDLGINSAGYNKYVLELLLSWR